MKMKKYPSVIIAGIRGGSGKTTVTLGLIGALSKKNKVSPFKKGPDYIDSAWMSKSAGYPCFNLDPYLIGDENVLTSFLTNFSGDLAVIEGNRGLYDGMDIRGSFSTAQLAKLLNVPVILVMDCTKITRTLSALLLGCMKFDEEVMIKGVILNQVSGIRHEKIIRESIEHYCKVPVLGAMPRLSDDEMPERHMGLIPVYEHNNTEKVIKSLTEKAVQYIDIQAVKDITIKYAPSYDFEGRYNVRVELKRKDLKIAVLKDEAFQFYYPENIQALEQEGAEIVYISTLEDISMPEVHGLYIGGGFPETNAIRLSENNPFKEALKNLIQKGLPVYAECGGFMYLGSRIVVDGQGYEMLGIFDIVFQMNKKPVAHGYTEVIVSDENPFYPIGTVLKGHEFHYSSVSGDLGSFQYTFTMKRGQGIFEKRDGIVYKNCLATYTHIHALGTKQWAIGMIKRASEFKNG